MKFESLTFSDNSFAFNPVKIQDECYPSDGCRPGICYPILDCYPEFNCEPANECIPDKCSPFDYDCQPTGKYCDPTKEAIY